jgi:DNA-binding CsgD family transcriptional regulator
VANAVGPASLAVSRPVPTARAGRRVAVEPVATVAVAALLDRSSDAFVAVDLFGRRSYSNHVYDRLAGIDGQQLIGRWGPFPDWERETEGAIRNAVVRLQAAHRAGHNPLLPVETTLRHGSGQLATVTMHLQVLSGPTGEPAHALALVKPVGRLPWLDRRQNLDAERIRVLEGVIQQVAVEISRIGVSTVAEHSVVDLPVDVKSRLADVSGREWEVLQQILLGRRVPAIADGLHISQHTVRNHLKAIFRKLGVRSQAELIELYRPVMVLPALGSPG